MRNQPKAFVQKVMQDMRSGQVACGIPEARAAVLYQRRKHSDLLDAAREILECAELCQDSIEPETIKSIARLRKAVAKG